ncbi:energy transducer TonB [Tenacibaculum sp. M341]|uniref:energy transducer TonB n=1 Tax=Tenacibaculum sp. M341 TaxID=2530339 RepID=UPI001045CA10|nr:energy transducer TonB [Tenacibaculum sp. M341]TCI84453.1 hypothetical protein EYW44_21370 [Tenacibaculum sp. M341]
MKKLKKNPKLQLEKFSTVFTQLGLVLVLFIVFIALEHETEVDKEVITCSKTGVGEVMNFPKDIPLLIVKEEVKINKPKQEKPKRKVAISKPPEIIKTDDLFKETDIKPTDNDTDFINTIKTVDEGDIIDEKEDPKPISMRSVQKAPVFKGCEGLSEFENRKCFERKMKLLVKRNFDRDLASELGLPSGKKRISTQFVIDETGKVIDVKVRAPHHRLEKEAKRIINKIPNFKPGMQNNKPAKVRYTLPISFMVE